MAVGLAQDLGLAQDFRDSAFSLDVISYSCWQVAENKNGPQLPIQQVCLCLQLTGLRGEGAKDFKGRTHGETEDHLFPRLFLLMVIIN